MLEVEKIVVIIELNWCYENVNVSFLMSWSRLLLFWNCQLVHICSRPLIELLGLS